jgi:hypothetical protein
MTDTNQSEPQAPTESPQAVLCEAAKENAVKGFILVVMFLGFGLWSAYDISTGAYPVPETPLSLEHINDWGDLLFNWGVAITAPLIGLIALVRVMRYRARKLEANAEGIGYVGKETYPWAAVTRLDASKLKAKDLLVLHIQPGSEEILLKLDGYKLTNFRALMKILETHIPQDRQTI